MSRLLSMLFLASLACSCLGEATSPAAPADAEYPAEPDGDAADLPDLVDPATLFFCGNGRCEPGEQKWSCPQDCEGVLNGEPQIEITPRLFSGSTEVEATLACGSGAHTGWLLGGLPSDTPLPYSTYITDCPLNAFDDGLPDLYAGRSARWSFTIVRVGRYRIRAWIPDGDYACSGPERLVDGANYYLLGPAKWTKHVVVAQSEHIDASVALFDGVLLHPGDYMLVLPDNAWGGCACRADIPCDEGLQTRRIYVDFVYVDSL